LVLGESHLIWQYKILGYIRVMGHEFTRIVCLYTVEIIGRNSHQAYSFQSSADISETVQERRIVSNMLYIRDV